MILKKILKIRRQVMKMYGSILVNGIEVTCYPNNDGGFWYFHPITREIIEVEG